MYSTEKLLAPLVTPAFTLNNRVVMAPMNRRRAVNGIPGSSAAVYYSQRATAGLIITDNTAVASNGGGYLHTPGIYNDAQKAGWKQVVDAVHAQQGKIFVQLVHAGRIGHPLNNENGAPVVAPSAVRAAGELRTPGDVYLPMPVPEALTTAGAKALVEAHIQAAEAAIAIGFDGVEIHGAHGFLPEQFLNPYTNHRSDRYGGSIQNRSRFLLEILEGVTAAIGKERTGIRLSPFAAMSDLRTYAEEKATHEYLTAALRRLDILYIHLSDASVYGNPPLPPEHTRYVRKHFPNLLMLAGGYTAARAEAVLQSGLADLVAFGRPFIANPDLVERFRRNAPLAEPDESTFYEGGDKGYTDYPPMSVPGHSACVAV
jgi:N-ethylmaleimide reductase